MKWTNEQREAIDYSGKNILLAAAAGSGKTAVLVQRIIEMISREADPVDINQLLVLTFTDAAAREMREKIGEAIETALREKPDNGHLQRQRLLIHSASISTIHSFCLQLLKNNIHMTDLPVNFSLISEIENKMLIDEVLSGVLERFYGKINRDQSIEELVMGYGGVKNDNTLRETVLGLFNFSKSMAHPAKWLNESVREFERVAKSGTVSGSIWQDALQTQTNQIIAEVNDIYNEIDKEIEQRLDIKHPYNSFFADERVSLQRLFSNMEMDNYTSVRDALLGFEFPRLISGKRNAEGEICVAQERIKALRQLAKDILNDLWELFKIEEADVVERIKRTYPVLRTLKNIVLICDRSHINRKREKNFLDFSDLEHETLKLLEGKNGEESPILAELRERYKEILIDEYQDTNNIQDTVFRQVSRENRNIFMVGDLKQSIYTFRNAVPKLFSDKYASYGKDTGQGHLIRLFKNFRSRAEVIDTVNFIFKSIMDTNVGDVDYTEEEYLIQGAEYPISEDWDFTPEFHFVCSNGEIAEDEEPLSKHQLEANIAAGRIKDIIGSGMMVFDKVAQRMRPAEYRDIVVLMRNTRAAAPVFEQVFEENKIPVYTEVGRSYLNSTEVQTVLSFLQIIDNPRQDIPLIATMRSPIWGFSPEQLGEMRSKKRDGYFFDAVEFAAETGDKKAQDFLTELNKLRQRAKDESTEKLIWSIYYKYGYYAYSGAANRGMERQANLRLLFERAAEFEHSGLSGLFNFMNYIEAIRQRGDDLTPAKTLSDNDNVVRIMTIHKSKGLEFPIVILADTGHDFNMMDLNKNIIWNTAAGIGMDYVDNRLRVRYPSLPRDIVAMIAKRELVSEEMRLLYVALTRAREKLIVTASFKQTKSGLGIPIYAGERVRPSYIQHKKCFRDWIMAALLMHPDGGALREYFDLEGYIQKTDSKLRLKTFVYSTQNEVVTGLMEATEKSYSDSIEKAVDEEQLSARLNYEYPNKRLTTIPVKLSVSEVKRMQSDDEYTPLLAELKVSGLRSLEKIIGAERGTIIHFVMQLAEPQKINSLEDAQGLICELTEKGILTQAQAKAVDAVQIFRFYSGVMGERIKKAIRLEREFSFYTKADIRDVYGGNEDGEILLQGTMDCFFEEQDGKVVLLDFKTDRAKDRDDAIRLAEKYRVQMKYYKKALSEILGHMVDECYLCFLDCDEYIEM